MNAAQLIARLGPACLTEEAIDAIADLSDDPASSRNQLASSPLTPLRLDDQGAEFAISRLVDDADWLDASPAGRVLVAASVLDLAFVERRQIDGALLAIAPLALGAIDLALESPTLEYLESLRAPSDPWLIDVARMFCAMSLASRLAGDVADAIGEQQESFRHDPSFAERGAIRSLMDRFAGARGEVAQAAAHLVDEMSHHEASQAWWRSLRF